MINSTGIVQQILEGGLSEKRGMDMTDVLPYYHYCDDGMLIWNHLGNYVKEYLDLYKR